MRWIDGDERSQALCENRTRRIHSPAPGACTLFAKACAKQSGGCHCCLQESPLRWIGQSRLPLESSPERHAVIARSCPLRPWQGQEAPAAKLLGLVSENGYLLAKHRYLRRCLLRCRAKARNDAFRARQRVTRPRITCGRDLCRFCRGEQVDVLDVPERAVPLLFRVNARRR